MDDQSSALQDDEIITDNVTGMSEDQNAHSPRSCSTEVTVADMVKESSSCSELVEQVSSLVEDESPLQYDTAFKAQTNTVFNLASQEGQEHLRELNDELKALNEQGSPKLSLLHGPNEPRPSTSQRYLDSQEKKHGKKRKKNIDCWSVESTPVDCKSQSSQRMHSLQLSKCKLKKIKKKLLASNDCESSNSVDDNPENCSEKLLDTTEDEIDRILEEKAWKANLTTINVKNILRYVVTNEHVLAMVRNSMQSDSEDVLDTLTEANFEPKLTRSKAKELIEKQAKVPWPISPIKMTTSVKSKSLIDLEFSESDASSDEEYKPNNDTVQSEDDESFVLPSVNETSILETSQLSASTEDNDLETDTVKLDALQNVAESEDTIALRTRSKLPLNDTPLEKIESEFLAPDITADMYDSECDDDEWKDFLGEFLRPLDTNSADGGDDETNDPEYNFLEEEDIPDSEDLRDDRAVKISKKELHGLMAELFEEAEAELAEAEEDDGPSAANSTKNEINHTPIFKILNQNLQREIHLDGPVPLFNNETRQQLNEQLRMHIQLLTQAFILSFDVAQLKTLSDVCKLLLIEIQTLADKNTSLYERPSAFAAHNLKDAIEIITNYADNSSFERVNNEAKRWQRLSCTAMSTLTHSSVFLYPELLPVCGFRSPAAFKRLFVNAEDMLLALGLEQFLHLKEFSCWELIREHMIPVKSTKQICIRTKNLRSAKYPFNPVKYFYQNKHAPALPRTTQLFDPEKVRAPIKQQFSLLPEWMKTYLSENQSVITTKPVAVKDSVARPTRPLLPALPAPSFIQLIPGLTVMSKNETSDTVLQSPSLSCPQKLDLTCPLNSIVLPSSVSGPGLGQSKGTLRLEKELPVQCLSSSLLNSSSKVLTTVGNSCATNTAAAAATIVDVVSSSNNKAECVTFVKPPEKVPSGCSITLPVISASLANTQVIHRLSPLKRVSPIIKKYSQKRLRKTGGNLRKPSQRLQKIMPKIIVSPVQYRPRSLAPKNDSCSSTTTTLVSSIEKQFFNNESQNSSAMKDTVETCESNKTTVATLEGGEPVNLPIIPLAVDTVVVSTITTPSGNSTDSKPSDLELKLEESDDVQKDARQEPLDTHESESEVEAEMFDDGEDTADDDAIDIQGDNEDDLAALMAASTTIKSTPRHRQTIISKNKKLKDRKALLKMLECDTFISDHQKEEKDTIFAQAYLQRVKETVSCNEKLFEEFVKLLNDFSNSDRNVVSLYHDICKLLKDFPDLCDEFVAFLLPEQAFECGKFMEHLGITRIQIFLKKLEAHFGKHPHHIQKILKLLTHLHQQTNLTMETIKVSLLPLFRGQQHLIEEFLQLFPQEAPPESCMTDFEEVLVPEGDEEIVLDEDGVEVIEVPDTRDQFGNQDCICSCHVSSEKSKVQNRLRHCVGCGIKFIDGRVFLQTGKVLKPCQVDYLYPNMKSVGRQPTSAAATCSVPNTVVRNDCGSQLTTTLKRLPVEGTEYASPSSSMSSLSPSASKESDSEVENGALLNKCPVADVPVDVPKETYDNSKSANRLLDVLEHISQDNTTTLNLPLSSDAVTEDAILTPDTSTQSGMQVPADFSILRSVINPLSDSCQSVNFEIHQCHGESQEGIRVTVSHVEGTFPAASDAPKNNNKDVENSDDMNHQYNNALTANPDIALKSETAAVVSTSSLTCMAAEVAEARSLTTELVDSDAFVNAKNHVVDGDGHVVVLWTRESDRILLQTCQQMGPGPEAFAEIASKLRNKSQTEVASRFQELMILFSQQANKPLLKSQKLPEQEHDSGHKD